MSIRLRYYLAILPLFLGVALINGLLVYTLDRQEIRWGLQQRAEGSAAVLAGFWPTLGQEPAERQRAKLRAFSRRLGGVAISGFSADGESSQLITMQGVEPALLDAATSAALQAGGMAWSWQERPTADSDLNIGYSAVPATLEGGLVAVAVAEPDRTLREATAALIQRLSTLSMVMLLAGVLVAEWLTRFARRELGALGEAARQLAGGHYLQHWPSGRIRELNDLGSTLLTMASLLADGSHQTRRRFFEAELLPGDADLAAALRQSVLPEALPEGLAQRCVWRCLGAPLAEEFFGYRRVAGGWWLLAGVQRPEPSARSELQRSLAALASRDALLQQLADAPAPPGPGPGPGPGPELALAQSACAQLQMLWLPDAGAARGWSLDPLTRSLQPMPVAPRFAMIGTVTREAIRLARTYEAQFSTRPLVQAGDDMAALLAGSQRGILVIAEAQLPVAEDARS
jgi:hypothetical protein